MKLVYKKVNRSNPERRIEHILLSTRDIPLDVAKLAEMMCISTYRVREYIKKIRKMEPKGLYIEKWEKIPGLSTMHLPFYRAGSLPDAPRPEPVRKVKPKPRVFKNRAAPLTEEEKEARRWEMSRKRALKEAELSPPKQLDILNALFGRKPTP